MIARLILVTPRYDPECYALLAAKFAGDDVVSVIEDRRIAQRRRRAMIWTIERRKGDRRDRSGLGRGSIVAIRPWQPLAS